MSYIKEPLTAERAENPAEFTEEIQDEPSLLTRVV